MKKYVTILICLISLSAAVKAQPDQIKIGLSLANQFVSRWVKEKDIMSNYIAAKGGQLIVKDARDNSENQLTQIRELLEMDVKVLIIVPIDSRSTALMVEEAKQKGVKVISYDRLILNSPVDYYVTFDSEKIGRMMANHMLNMNPKGNFVLLNGPREDFNTILIRKGVYAVLNDEISKANVNLVKDVFLSEWSEVSANVEFEDFLNTYKDPLQGVMAGCDEIAIGALKALQSKNIKNVHIIGQDADLKACKLVASGELSATIWQDIDDLARQTADLAMKLAQNQALDVKTVKTKNGMFAVPSILLDPVLVTKENMDEILIQTNFYTREELYGN